MNKNDFAYFLLFFVASHSFGQQPNPEPKPRSPCLNFDGWRDGEIIFKRNSLTPLQGEESRFNDLFESIKVMSEDKCCGKVIFLVTGFFNLDEISKKSSNLAEARAEYVHNILTQNGIKKSDICFGSYGKSFGSYNSLDLKTKSSVEKIISSVDIRAQCAPINVDTKFYCKKDY